MNELFSRHHAQHQQDETESPWFKVAHALVGVLVLIALLMLAASGWENLVGASNLSAQGIANLTTANTEQVSATQTVKAAVPDAATVFRGTATPIETLPPSF
jgi:hypothetical protein